MAEITIDEQLVKLDAVINNAKNVVLVSKTQLDECIYIYRLTVKTITNLKQIVQICETCIENKFNLVLLWQKLDELIGHINYTYRQINSLIEKHGIDTTKPLELFIKNSSIELKDGMLSRKTVRELVALDITLPDIIAEGISNYVSGIILGNVVFDITCLSESKDSLNIYIRQKYSKYDIPYDIPTIATYQELKERNLELEKEIIKYKNQFVTLQNAVEMSPSDN
jgi:3-methyladenine DNA glycosylase Tag